MRALICGTGFAGLTLALVLERFGHEIVLVERTARLHRATERVDLCASGFDTLEVLGVLPELTRAHHPVRRFVFADEEGNERLSLPYSLVRQRWFDDRHVSVLRREFQQLMFDRFLAARVEPRFGTTVQEIEQKGDHVRVQFSDGCKEAFDLIIGADGAHSDVRRLAFGTERGFARPLGCRAASFVIDEVLDGVDPQAFTTITGPGRLVAVHPIRGGGTAAFFLYRVDEGPDPIAADAVPAKLRQVYGEMAGMVPELLQHASTSRLDSDAVLQIEVPRWSVGRVVLVGDACHSVSPIAGQSASSAVASACALGEELIECKHDISRALTNYEERVKPRISAKQATARRLADWFVPSNGFALAWRDLGLRMASWPFASALARRSLSIERAGALNGRER